MRGDLVNLILLAGQIILRNGGETYRVEETMTRIAYACGADKVEVFAIPPGIFCTVQYRGDLYTRMIRVNQRGINLHKVLEVNRISRFIVEGQLTPDEAYQQLLSLEENNSSYPVVAHTLAGAVASGIATYLLGGQLTSIILAGGAGFIVMMLTHLLQKLKMVYFISLALMSAIAASINLAAVYFWPKLQFEIAVVGSILVLVPGVAITSSLRDALSEDLASASFRAVEALGAALSIAVGVGSVVALSIYV